MTVFELKPMHDRAKSFYGKATVFQNLSGKYILKSYQTDVCYIDSEGLHRTWDGYSVTTLRHVDEFSRQILGKPVNKKTWCAMEVEPKAFIV